MSPILVCLMLLGVSTCGGQSDQETEESCVFPFTFRGVTYSACADWTFGGQPAGTSWCSTKVDRRGVHVKGSYKFCSSPTSCPPPPGESPPPGCSLTFIQDQGGEIDCQEDEDCPYR